MQILNPPAGADPDRADNDRSVVLRVSVGKFVALLMADAGFGAEGRLINERLVTGASVLKIGHHGSKSSTGEEFLKAVHPACALVSCGRKNRYGHPADEAVQRLAAVNATILRTDRHGAIVIDSDGETVSVKARAGFHVLNTANQ